MANEKTDIWQTAAQAIVSAGMIPVVISETLIKLLQELMTEEQADFLNVFMEKPSLNIDQIKEKTELPTDALEKMLSSLMYGGILVGIPSKRTGIMVYRLLGPFPGLFEYTNLRGETGEKQKRLARLFETLFDEMRNFTQEHYDVYVDQAKNFPPVVRIIPVEEEVAVDSGDKIMPFEEASKIVDKFEHIALAHCYCRHSRDLVDEPCETTDDRLNCILLGKSAQFAAEYKFGNLISKEEARQVLTKASDEGLVHKAFHIHLKTDLDEEAICNCCKCCCGPFQMYYRGAAPYHCVTNYLAQVDSDACTACEKCIDMCPMETIEMKDDAAQVVEQHCIGCGVCVHHCADDAIELQRIETRKVFIPPKRVAG
jgi:Pyruvate/2-oxoacid:ferredoxin oxidoreductase delta subunit